MKTKIIIISHSEGEYDNYTEIIDNVLSGNSNKTSQELIEEWRKTTWKPKIFPSGKHMGKMSKQTYETITLKDWLIKNKKFTEKEFEIILDHEQKGW